MVPACAVLIGEQHRLASGPDTSAQPRGLQLHQREQALNLGLTRHQRGEDPPEPQGLSAQRRADPVLAGGRRVALVEDQVDHLEHRDRRSASSSRPGRSNGTLGLDQRPFGPDDALRDGRLGHEERSGDLGRRQAAEQAQRQRHARVADNTGWQVMKIRRRTSSSTSSTCRDQIGLVELL